MDLKKKQAFNQKMGRAKYPRHQNLANGGIVKRFADGGGVADTSAGPQGPLGAISNALGTNNNFRAGIANIQPGTNATQLNNAYTGANNALNTQTGLTNTLVPQAAQGVTNQGVLANQYLAMTQGQGPNPALAQLNQTTGTNVANQAALMAGQRGAASNVGLLARQAANQGAATQQQAVGQGATLAAQQQIAAQQNLANLSANQVGQAGQATTALNAAQQNEQNTLLGANAGYNNANVGMQSNINNVNAQVAGANQNQNNGILGGITGALSSAAGAVGLAHGGEVKMAEGGVAGNPLLSSPTPSAPAPNWAGQYMSPASVGGGPSVEATQSLPENETPSMGDAVKDARSNYQTQKAGKTVSGFDKQLDTIDSGMQSAPELGSQFASAAPTLGFASGGKVYHSGYFHEYFAGGGMAGGSVDAIVSPKEVYLNPRQVKEVVERGADPIKIGHHFAGHDKVKRDSMKNDVIKTKLEEGGVVLPIHITTHKDASHRGRKFIERAVAKHMKRPGGA